MMKFILKHSNIVILDSSFLKLVFFKKILSKIAKIGSNESTKYRTLSKIHPCKPLIRQRAASKAFGNATACGAERGSALWFFEELAGGRRATPVLRDDVAYVAGGLRAPLSLHVQVS